MTPEEIAVAEFLLEQLEARFGNYDPELREHIIAASNRMYVLNHEPETEQKEETDEEG